MVQNLPVPFLLREPIYQHVLCSDTSTGPKEHKRNRWHCPWVQEACDLRQEKRFIQSTAVKLIQDMIEWSDKVSQTECAVECQKFRAQFELNEASWWHFYVWKQRWYFQPQWISKRNNWKTSLIWRRETSIPQHYFLLAGEEKGTSLGTLVGLKEEKIRAGNWWEGLPLTVHPLLCKLGHKCLSPDGIHTWDKLLSWCVGGQNFSSNIVFTLVNGQWNIYVFQGRKIFFFPT